jgi:Amiloride-sensitive sodium channel
VKSLFPNILAVFFSKNFNFRSEYSEIRIFIKENQVLTKKREERYGNIDFLANCGGLLGLCLGVSVLSFVEIVYFCTFRLRFEKRMDEPMIMEEPQRNLIKTRRYLKISQDLIRDYVNKTTIQGVKYLAEPSLTSAERIWWMIILFISVFACGSLIFDILRRYDQSPAIINFANEETPISQVELE